MRILDFLVADDIRREQGHKISVMGLYNDAINLNVEADASWPILFRLGIYIRILKDRSEENPDRFVLRIILNDASIAEVGGNIVEPKEESNLVTLPLIANPLPLPSLGVLNFQLELFKGDANIFSTTSPFPIVLS